MEDRISELKLECKELQQTVKKEKAKLADMRQELEEYAKTDSIRIEQSMSRRRGRQIEAAKNTVEKLTTECRALTKAINVVEKDKVDMTPQSYRDMETSLNEVLREIGLTDDELYDLEAQVNVAKEENVWLEKDHKTKLRLFLTAAEAEKEEKLMTARIEEDELRFSLEQLQTDVKKEKDAASAIRQKIAEVKALIKDEEKRNVQIQEDLDMWYHFGERIRKDEEKAQKGCGEANAA